MKRTRPLLKPLPPIASSEKRLIRAKGAVNQVMPFKYPWAWNFFLQAQRNHWSPKDVNMTGDVTDYEHKLTPSMKHVFEHVLGYLGTADIMALYNVSVVVLEKTSAPELQAYQAVQGAEEAIHTWAYTHAIETIGLPQDKIYNLYRTVPQILRKVLRTKEYLDKVTDPSFDIDNNDKDLKEWLLGYIFFAGIFEGVWFYNGFTPIYALQRLGLMKGTAEQLQYIQRDENLHAAFGLRAIKEILKENPQIDISDKEIHEIFYICEWDEEEYIEFIIQDDTLGYTIEQHMQNYKFLSNRRCRQLGISEPYPDVRETGTPWLDEQANLRKEKNFFETTVTEYSIGNDLGWDKDDDDNDDDWISK